VIVAVIPCHNEGQTIAEIVVEAKKHVGSVVVADDGSTDATASLAGDAGARVVANNNHHRGMGGNVRRGMEAVPDASILVTLDGDGQHLASEIPLVLGPIMRGEADLVIGSRFLGTYKVARYRKLGIDIITWLYNIGQRQRIVDAQCCFRVYNRASLNILDIEDCGFGFSTEILIKARAKGLRIVEVPVSCVYHEDFEQNSCMNPVVQGLRVVWATLRWRLKVELIPYLFKTLSKPLLGHGLGNVKMLRDAFEMLTRSFIHSQIVDVGCHQRLLVDADTGGIATLLLFEGEYEPQTTKVFKQLLRPDMVVVDVGANIGYFSVISAWLAKTVYAFEPETKNFGRLVENIKLNGLENVLPIQKAVSSSNGKKTLYVSKHESGEHSLVRGRIIGTQTATDVETVRLDDIVESADLIKIDTEGNELAVLQGAERLLESGSVMLIIEVFSVGLELAGTSTVELWTFLEERGFKYMYLIDEHKHETRPASVVDVMHHIEQHKFSVNVLCMKEPFVGD